jgi:putative glycerol-1-phosphate prenyltransferase
MTRIYQQILKAKGQKNKLLAVLLDPDKIQEQSIRGIVDSLDPKRVDFLLVGGSTVANGTTEKVVKEIKSLCEIPVLLFPGDYSQVSAYADGLLYLNLLSGRNPEYLVEQQVKAVPAIRSSGLEVIPTAYLLIDGGVETAVQRVSNTKPMDPKDVERIEDTACAGMYMGNKLIYLEAGSGARQPVPEGVIRRVAGSTDLPLLVGGGIRSKSQLEQAYASGADIVVIGTAFEENINHLKKIFSDEHFH